MSKKRRFALSLLLIPTLLITLASAPTVSAGSLGHGDDAAGGGSTTSILMRLTNATIPWAFPPPDGMTNKCPDIPVGVNINPDDQGSNRVQRATVTSRTDGTKLVVITDNTIGTAHDNSGNTYKFTYYNKATLASTARRSTSRWWIRFA